jgi:enoyl-CoA hydratase/carnithine racemase
MTDDAVHLDVADQVATITLDEPATNNALTVPISQGIRGALAEVSDTDARCVVIESTGDAFSAGGDVNAMLEGLHGDVAAEEKVETVVETGEAVRAVYEFELPVVAKVDGMAYGAGANLAIACDVQFASEDAAVSFGFRQVGLAVDAGTSYLLPRVVGENTAKELVYTGEILGAREAADLGLFTSVTDADDFESAAAEYVDQIATGPTVALKASKRLLRQGGDAGFEAAVVNEANAQTAVFETHDHEEGATAFMEQRDPEYEGR